MYIGPGTLLSGMLERWGFKASPGCRCRKTAAKMDAFGPDWCRKNTHRIVRVMQWGAMERKFPFSRLAARAVLNRAIRKSERSLSGGE